MDEKTVIKRDILTDLRNHLEKKEITLIVGPRQAGKTTLMRILEKELQEKSCPTLFLSLDRERDATHFSSQEALLEKIRLDIGMQKGYVFIDEIQRKENAGVFLKGIYDLGVPYKFVVSGSGSIELKEKIHESLAGRKLVFSVYPLSIFEYINFRTAYRYEDRLSNFFAIEKEQSDRLLDEYLRFGGYPRVVLAETLEMKARVIDEIFQSYIEKDISHLLRVEKLDAFRLLVEILASQSSQLVTASELASTLSVSFETARNYLWYLEHTFIIDRVTPFFRNKRKEITKTPVMYFTDLGLRNYAVGRFGITAPLPEIGFLFQNLIYHILKQQIRFSGARIHYWRTKDQAEVDFIVTRGESVIPLEVKYTAQKNSTLSRSLSAFIKRYHPADVYIVTRETGEGKMVGTAKLVYAPYFDIPLL